ncbi:uncharacterized protein PGRI_018320 [Penicillium griseofulvum]|uniref:Glycosyl transferase, family 8 n=1 Tax=Penicillium patulum TaxID=5078 RepID=A0A135LG49_PENPA|nr:uncharacterized protein PGRI_018320 [Penicillium griseofulvum]KXG47962.1 hypothetical protein PGRI_018320 [Penicillium griseofulvum]
MSSFNTSDLGFAVGAGNGKHVDWSRFAYTQYATDRFYLCNSLMLFESLHRLGSKADRVLMYPSEWPVSEEILKESRMLRYARHHYGVKLKPIEIQIKFGSDKTWSKSYTKLLAFNQTEYGRILNLDSDATILQTMDELFLAPSSSVAMPLAYWKVKEKGVFTSALILIQPSAAAFDRTMDAISTANSSTFDMEIMNNIYKETTLTIPHRPYILLTGEFRSNTHEAYLGNSGETWDAEKVFKETKYLHFSDWPVPKPWIKPHPGVVEEYQPPCELNPATGQKDDCRAKNLCLINMAPTKSDIKARLPIRKREAIKSHSIDEETLLIWKVVKLTNEELCHPALANTTEHFGDTEDHKEAKDSDNANDANEDKDAE